MTREAKDRPDFKSEAYQCMAEGWPYVCDTVKGTLHLRAQKEKYLPPFPKEDRDIYADRLRTAVFFNAVAKCRNGLVGLIFQKDPQLGKEVPAEIREQLENVDLQGTHWAVFAKEVETSAVEYGHALILVDMQPALGEGATLADERANGRRPYWVHYRADQAINWRTTTLGGVTQLEQITFEERGTEPDGLYGERAFCRYRVFTLTTGEDGKPRVGWSVQRKQINDKGEESFSEEASGFTSMTEIPVAVIYARKSGFMTSSPPLLDLAMLNIKHYQQGSEYDNTLHICGFPMLWKDDDNDDSVMAVGPSLMITVARGSKVAYAEPQGSSLEAQAKNLETKKQEMAVMGLSFVAERAQVEVTATESKIDNAQETSELATMARSLKDGLERCLGFTAQYMGRSAKEGGSIEMAQAAELTLSNEELRLISDMVERGQLDLDTMWSLMRRAGKLPSDFNADEARERLEASKPQPMVNPPQPPPAQQPQAA